jgi:regulator of replication initiation timing
MDQIENVTYRDVPDLQTRIDDLLDEHDAEQMEVGRLRMRLVDCEEKMVRKETEMTDKVEAIKEGKEKVQGYLDTLRGFVEGKSHQCSLGPLCLFAYPWVTEMKTLRNTTEREVKEEVETLRQIRKMILEEVRHCLLFLFLSTTLILVSFS